MGLESTTRLRQRFGGPPTPAVNPNSGGRTRGSLPPDHCLGSGRRNRGLPALQAGSVSALLLVLNNCRERVTSGADPSDVLPYGLREECHASAPGRTCRRFIEGFCALCL